MGEHILLTYGRIIHISNMLIWATIYAAWGYKLRIRKLWINLMKNAKLSNYLSENPHFQSMLCSDREGPSCFFSRLAFFFFFLVWYCFKLSVWVKWNWQDFRGTFSLLHHAARTIMGEAALSAFMQIFGNAHQPHAHPSCNTQLCELGQHARKHTDALKHDQKRNESYVTAWAPWYVSLPDSFEVNKRSRARTHTHTKQVTQLYGILGRRDHAKGLSDVLVI